MAGKADDSLEDLLQSLSLSQQPSSTAQQPSGPARAMTGYKEPVRTHRHAQFTAESRPSPNAQQPQDPAHNKQEKSRLAQTSVVRDGSMRQAMARDTGLDQQACPPALS